MSDQTELPARSGEVERHATNIELFLDLVFVFAVSQIVAVMAADQTLAGFGKGLLLGWLVWWLWSQFAWLGTAVDLGGSSRNQLLVLVTIPLTLLVAIAIPQAYEGAGLKFAAAYLAVNSWCLVIQGQSMWSNPVERAAWLRYGPFAMIAPILLLLGALLDGNARIAAWSLVAVVTIASALAGGRQGSEGSNAWRINPTHFAERHALFVIICLGEVMVAIGVSAASTGIPVAVGVGVLVTAALACSLWWAYFAYVPRAVEHTLATAAGDDRARFARDLFTFGHFPIVFGILLYALAAKHVVADPSHHLGAPDLFALAASITLFAGGLTALRWRAVHSIGWERPGAILAVVLICAIAGPLLPGVVVIAITTCVILVMAATSLRRVAPAGAGA